MTDILALKSRLASLSRGLGQMATETAAIAASIEAQSPIPLGFRTDVATSLAAWDKYCEAQRARWRNLSAAQAETEAAPQIAREMKVRMAVERYKSLTALDSETAINVAAIEIIALSKIS